MTKKNRYVKKQDVLLKYDHLVLIKIQELNSDLIGDGKEAIFVWVHLATLALAAKDAFDGDAWDEYIPFSCLKSPLNNYHGTRAKSVGLPSPERTAQDQSKNKETLSILSFQQKRKEYSALITYLPFIHDFFLYFFPRSGELRTQKLKSHLVRTQSLNVLPLKPGVDQYIAIHATLTARDFFLAYSPAFFQNLSWFLLCWRGLTHGSCVGPQNKLGHLLDAGSLA